MSSSGIATQTKCTLTLKVMMYFLYIGNIVKSYRYTVKVTEDHLATVQINTSKQDVYIKLVILDNETEVATTQGKGHAVIPSFIFLKDFDPNEEKRPSSRACKFMISLFSDYEFFIKDI
jgi:hypothetical protein